MGRAGTEFGGPAKERSGWLIPLAVFLVTAVLTGLVLLYYLSPTPSELIEEQSAPTDSSSVATLRIGPQEFHIPGNYIPYASARKGGSRTEVKLVALLPDLEGYSVGEASAFASDAADSRVLNLTLRAQPIYTERERLDRIYLPQVADVNGAPGPYGLTQFTFKPSSSYRDEDLFVAKSDTGPVVLRCTKPLPDSVAPTCLRDQQLVPGLALSYRFKRSHLADWADIDKSVREMIATFMRKS